MLELNKFVKKTPKRIFETEETVETKLIRAATSAFYSNLCISNGNMLVPWIPKYNYNNVETKLKEIISSTKESLKLQNFPYFIEEFGIKAIVCHGEIVSDIHFEDDFDTILISKLPNTTTKNDLLNLLSRYGQLNQIELLHSKNKNSWAYITFDKKESAKLALTLLNGFEQPFSIQIKNDPLQHASPKSIQIRWYLGEPISLAFIEFKSEVDAYKAVGLGAKLSTKGDKRNTIYIPINESLV
jgi:RNA recognition motif-containing protein